MFVETFPLFWPIISPHYRNVQYMFVFEVFKFICIKSGNRTASASRRTELRNTRDVTVPKLCNTFQSQTFSFLGPRIFNLLLKYINTGKENWYIFCLFEKKLILLTEKYSTLCVCKRSLFYFLGVFIIFCKLILLFYKLIVMIFNCPCIPISIVTVHQKKYSFIIIKIGILWVSRTIFLLLSVF